MIMTFGPHLKKKQTWTLTIIIEPQKEGFLVHMS